MHQIPVEAGILIRAIQSQRVVVGFQRLLPGPERLLRILPQRPLPDPVEGITKVVVGLLLDLQIRGVERVLQLLRRLLELAARVGFGTPVVVRHHVRAAIRWKCRAAQQQQCRRLDTPRHRGQRLLFLVPPALADHRLQRQQQHRRAQRPLEPFQRHLLELLRQLALRRQRQPLLIDRVQALGPAPQRHVEPAGRRRDLLEGFSIQFRPHDFSVLILEEFLPPVAVAHRDQLAVHRADPDGINGRSFLRRFLRRFQGLAFQVLAVGDQDKEALVVPFLVEKPSGLVDRARQIRALPRDQVGVQRVQGLPEGIVIQGQRAERERRPGERHQAHPVAFQVLEEIDDPQPGPFQPVRNQILRQHAARGVDREQDVDPAPLHFTPFVAELWPRRRQRQGHHRHQPEPAPRPPQRGRPTGHQPAVKARVRQLVEVHPPAAVRPQEGQQTERDQHHSGGDPPGLREL